MRREPRKLVSVKMDLEGLAQRILALPVPERTYTNLQATEDKLFYLELLPNQGLSYMGPKYSLNVFDFKERKSEVFVDSVHTYWVSADGKSCCTARLADRYFPSSGYRQETRRRMMARSTWTPWKSGGSRAGMAADLPRGLPHPPRLLLRCRHARSGSGSSLPKYLPFLEHVGHRDDLNYLLSEFSGELVAGHASWRRRHPCPRAGAGGPAGRRLRGRQNGYYRIKRIYPGLNWHPELRSPLTEPGVNVQEGEYILAVNGRPLRAPDQHLQPVREDRRRVTDLLVGPSRTDKGRAPSRVRPVGSEPLLRHWTWVEDNRKKVDELSDGRLAYVYMPDTAIDGYTQLQPLLLLAAG